MPNQQAMAKMVSGFVQMTDVMPTLLRLLGLKPPSRVTGKNFWPLVTRETQSLHEYVVQTYGWVGAVRTREWNYSEIWKPEAHQEQFRVHPGAPLATYKPQLYNLEKDPEELNDVADRYPDVVSAMSAKLKDYIAAGNGLTCGSFNEKAGLDTGEVYVKEAR